jgi:acyl-CoA synthetase (AMP-forming)/AMP-acid ligase II
VELVSVGTPLPGTELDVPKGRVGPVKVRGPSIMAGYLHQPERTAQVLVDGWLDTGDLGFFHEGELYLTGRAKDVVILRGQNHAPHEIEQAVDSLDGVRTGCAAAVAHRREDAEAEELILFVEARPDAGEGLADRCANAVLTATGLLPALVVLLAPGTLPRTSSGKIRRGEALARWLAGELVPPEQVTPWMLAGALARGTLAHWRARLGR